MTACLEDNVYNRTVRADQPKFKLWHSAGLMLTYGCPSQCDCCYVNCGPQTGSAQTEMSCEMAIACWQSIRRLAGSRGKVHLTGGEPFQDYPRLLSILQRRCELQLEGLEKIETNAYWCTRESLVRERFLAMAKTGPTKIQISADIYHQAFVPIERVLLAIDIAREVLGEDGIQVRWRDFLAHPVEVAPMTAEEKALAYKKTLAQRPERLLGRAVEKLASLFPSRNYSDFSDVHCAAGLLGAGHVHIDGAGHVFVGTCMGIIAGRLTGPTGLTLDELWKVFDFRKHPVWSILAVKGPHGLAEMAREDGFIPRQTYAGKCHLCYEVRQFWHHCGRFKEWLGPANCYQGY